MKIIYEHGDQVTVEDNSDAGNASSKDVILVTTLGDGYWKVEIMRDGLSTGEFTMCHERYFNP